ncbi:amidase domain-containing protein [Intrasporangium mesophilum]
MSFGSGPNSRARGIAALLVLAAAMVLGPSLPATAYNPVGAKDYANTYALSRNLSYPNFAGTDCANFVSQAVHAGGYSFVGSSNPSSLYEWWIHGNWYGTWDYATTWSVAPRLRYFFIYDVPGGISYGTAPGSSTNYWTPDQIVTGDVLFYDWGQGEGISHTAIQVGWGDDPNSTINGNFVDAHATDRYHAFWSLRPYNKYFAQTTVYFMHIAANNY